MARFQSLCNHEIYIKLNLPILLVLVEQRGKSQKYFDLSAFDWDLNHSNLCNTGGAVNFQKLELFYPVVANNFILLKNKGAMKHN